MDVAGLCWEGVAAPVSLGPETLGLIIGAPSASAKQPGRCLATGRGEMNAFGLINAFECLKSAKNFRVEVVPL